MDKAERTYLIHLLQESEAGVMATLQDVSEETFYSKPFEEQWSLAEIVEHLVLIDTSVLSSILKHASRIKDTVPETWEDKKLVKIVQSRTRKVQAPDLFVPQGRFNTKSEALVAYRSIRSKLEGFVETTDLPVEKIAFNHMFLGLLNAKNWIAFIAGHCKRHVLQMEEVKTFF